MMKAKNGFTLLELLVVVAIMGVLLAIAIPNVDSFINVETQEVPLAEYRYIAIDEDNKMYYCNEYDLDSERSHITDACIKIGDNWEKVRAYLFPDETSVVIIDNQEWLDDSLEVEIKEY